MEVLLRADSGAVRRCPAAGPLQLPDHSPHSTDSCLPEVRKYSVSAHSQRPRVWASSVPSSDVTRWPPRWSELPRVIITADVPATLGKCKRNRFPFERRKHLGAPTLHHCARHYTHCHVYPRHDRYALKIIPTLKIRKLRLRRVTSTQDWNPGLSDPKCLCTLPTAMTCVPARLSVIQATGHQLCFPIVSWKSQNAFSLVSD